MEKLPTVRQVDISLNKGVQNKHKHERHKDLPIQMYNKQNHDLFNLHRSTCYTIRALLYIQYVADLLLPQEK